MLLILGNGFDLQSGLRTDYISFFNKRYNKEIYKDLKKSIRMVDYKHFSANQSENDSDSNVFTTTDLLNRYKNVLFYEISIWDFIFISEDILSKNPGWYNIENLIFDYVSNNKLTYAAINGVEKNIRNNSFHKEDKLSIMLYIIFKELKITFTPMRFNEWLLEQLKMIEIAFKDYVIEEVRVKNEIYYNRTKRFYEFFVRVKDFDNKPLSLLNFNYTSPIGFENKLSSRTNIHGSINGEEIIFGIDEKNSEHNSWISPDETKYLFTKTARVIHSIDSDDSFLLNKNNDRNILIYGHSLNVQDYSYFQSVFDVYNISEGNVIIYICWSNYDKKRKIRSNTVNNAIRLLKYYGDSLKNDKGKNLLHRLLLEKRLRIVEFPDLSKD